MHFPYYLVYSVPLMLLSFALWGLLGQGILRPRHVVVCWVVVWALGQLAYQLIYRPTAEAAMLVGEAQRAARYAQDAVREYFYETGVPPMNREEAGLPLDSAYLASPQVRAVDIVQGAVIVTLSDRAGPLAGKSLTMTPYEFDLARNWSDKPTVKILDRRSRYEVHWRCGNGRIREAQALLGTAAGGPTAIHLNTTVPDDYLPAVCRTPTDR